jgi:hypothetical protein
MFVKTVYMDMVKQGFNTQMKLILSWTKFEMYCI